MMQRWATLFRIPSRYQQGFALLDLLMGMAVLALLMLVAMPVLRPGTSPLRQEAYAAEIAALLKSERATAAQSIGSSTGIRIDVSDRRIFAAARSRAIQLPADLALDVTSSDACRRERGSFVISFDVDGRSCGAVIHVSKGDRVWSVRINWLTGYVDVTSST